MATTNALSDDEGVVYKKTIGIYFVHAQGRTIPCTISNRLRKELVYPTAAASSLRRRVQQVKEQDHSDPVAVGDVVCWIDAGDGSGQIVVVLPRRNWLARRGAVPHPGAHAFEQVVAANLDLVIPIMAAANPAPHWNLLDRYLASAESFDLPALVCINKLDLARGPEIRAIAEEYRRIGYPVLLVSAVTGEGIAELCEALRGKVTVFTGKSGVGKTSLLNALQPGLGQRVSAVNQATGKGRHTTTSLEMFPLEGGGAVLDTPGVREYGLWDVEPDELDLLFPEMRPLVGSCRFGLDCRHDEEPGCAVRRAVMAGQISPRRYKSYLRLREDGGMP